MITNYLSPLEFRVVVKRLPNVEFYIQRAVIPSVSTNPVEVPSPFNKTFQTPDKMNFSNLDLTFIVDENMNNYIEVRNWLNDVAFPRNFNEFKTIKNSEFGLQSDISIQVLNSHKNANIEINYINCFPISISDVVLDTTQGSTTYPEATATFQYDSFTITKL